ncbi:TPA: hypothetical protein ACVU5P_004179 [Vibrio parahaemolyticus]
MTESIKEQLKNWTVLPPKPGTCPECGVKHNPNEPHNKDSLAYQYQFAKEHGRWPTWKDASAHCSEEAICILKGVLTKHSVEFE